MKFLASTLLLLFSLLLTGDPALAQSQNPSFLQGLSQFRAQDYRAALESFKKAGQESPSNVPIQLWLGLAHVGVQDGWTAQDVWRAGIDDEKWGAAVWALKGLDFWSRGDKKTAIYYFKEAQPKQRGYEINRDLMARISSDGDMPPLEQWPALVGLEAAAKSAATTPSQTTPPAAGPASTAGARPQPGHWRGVITNQGGDQVIDFRVSADGSLLTDITFVGYWRCPSAFNPTQSTRNAPPESVPVQGGAFSSTQNDKPSRLWYEFIGRFESSASASGTLRIAYAGGECDTYKLTWKAQRVGP